MEYNYYVTTCLADISISLPNLIKRLAARLADKWKEPHSKTMAWLRCRLTFSLLRSAIQCIRGGLSSCGHACTHILSPHGPCRQYLSSSWTNHHCKVVHIHCIALYFYFHHCTLHFVTTLTLHFPSYYLTAICSIIALLGNNSSDYNHQLEP